MVTTLHTKHSPAILIALLTIGCFASSCLRAEANYGELAERVSEMLEEEHFLRQDFDDSMSERTLDSYIEMLDFSRVYFTAEDIEKFRAAHLTTIDDQIAQDAIPAAFEIYKVYEERVQDRIAFIETLIQPGVFTYDGDGSVQRSRKDAEWASSGAEHDDLWRRLIEADLIREKMIADSLEEERLKAIEEGKPPKESDEDEESIYEKVSSRYDRILQRVSENTTEDVATFFIKAISHAYDPHSEYFSQQQYDNFRIGMNKSLTGIGAMLQEDEEQGGATIEGLVVGGPAAKDGELEVKDRVIGVAQDDDEFVDVIDADLGDIVDLIRGEIGTTVRLKVIPLERPDEIKIVDIVRDRVDLKESLATADLIITQDPEGNEQKIGWIVLPSFYADMDGGKTSTTKDVRRLITRLVIEGVDGIVVDLRNNGGGSLEEAINMTGLFIRRGPVVQSVDFANRRDQKSSRNGEAVYSGPLAVLINKASASASEIFAAALQDYGRAVVVGGQSSFGKGTVQQLRPVISGSVLLPFNRAANQQGALKLTIQTFYRINGDSTQRDGVIPDIILPSALDVAEIGEATLPNALEVAPIKPSRYQPFFEQPLPIELLQQASEARVASGQGFKYILENIDREIQRRDENRLSLNLAQRKRESDEIERLAEERKQERIQRYNRIRKEEEGLFAVYTFTQDNVLSEGRTLKTEISEEELSGMSRGSQEDEEADPEEKALEYPHGFDPHERETIHIIQDLIAIDETGKPVNISSVEPESRPATVPIEENTGAVAQ
ncbi:MAG: carboxy terminal-processing peptidase [Verrucomicrobiota bacterium]